MTHSTGPEAVYEILVVGGGPGGTAAAFRARELGLSVMVIDYDDLMKRIRDYSKDKLILPGFGGGDRMAFPKGGTLVSQLPFGPIDKDDMCAHWKGLYHGHGVPFRTGIEFQGLDRRADGVFQARCWNHLDRKEQTFLARYVVLAIGHGVPRRFDIPGNTEGIAFRLDDPEKWTGRPVCVIGGGTSAAEAVIAISNAKARVDDSTPVYWSYRGDRLPRVSKALAEVFFEAYMGHGNIRYFPKSEPAAVITGEDRKEYLAIRTDRRNMAGRPTETTHLEFPKDACIACIGEDIPEALLSSIDIPMVAGGPRNKKRMVANRFLESTREGVYLVGDILSQVYFRTDQADANPGEFEEMRHRGNIKTAMRDGVLVAEVIKQRLDGKTEIHVEIEDADEPSSSSTAETRQMVVPGGELGKRLPTTERPAAYLLRVLPTGVVERDYPLKKDAVTTIGVEDTDIALSEDQSIGRQQASISSEGNRFTLWDSSGTGALFLRLRAASKTIVAEGDLIRLSKQFLMIAGESGSFQLVHYDRNGKLVNKYSLSGKPLVLGRESLDPKDMALSRRHLALSVQDGSLIAKDLKSVNGSYLRVREAVDLSTGDRFQIGRSLLTFSRHREAALDVDSPQPVSLEAAPVQTSAPLTEGPSVTFKGLGKTFAASPGQTICEVAEANQVPINAECHAGICGSDPIRVIAGGENLETPPGDQESETLEDLCGLEPGPCRLACMARIRGPVTVEIVV